MPDIGRRRTILFAASAVSLLAAATAVALYHPSSSTVEAAAKVAPTSSAEALAQAQAKATGRPVTVDGDTTATSTTVANPNGTFTYTGHAQPTSVRKNGAWVPIDASLKPQADGTLAPAAIDASVRVSGGGTAPVTTFDDKAGHTFSIGVSMPLPAPVVTGPTALYRSVMPGVDLSVTTSEAGVVRQVFVVHDAAAAANPAIARLVLPVATQGLTLNAGPEGALSAVDPKTGKAIFTASRPVMWDSTLPPGLAQAKPGDLAPDSGDRLVSGVDGPGVGAVRTAVPTTVDGNAIVLSPPADALAGSKVTYPVFIDPPFSQAANPYAYVESQHPNVTDYMPTDDLRVGYDDWTTGCNGTCYINGVTRSYMTFNNVAGLNGKYIQTAVLQLNQLRSSCSGTSATINASIVNYDHGFDNTLNWSNQWGHSDIGGSGWLPGGSAGGVQIDQMSVANWAFTNGYTQLNLVLWASNETDHCIYRHYSLNPAIVISYISQPNAPASLQEVNGTASFTCNSTSPGPTLSAASANQITLQETVSSPDQGDVMTVHFYVSVNGGAATDHSTSATESSPNTPITASVPLTLTDGATYAWNSNTTNAAFTSPPSPTCYFKYDSGPPTAPVITSTAYPVNGPTTVTAGGSGVISWTSTDSGGVAGYNYNLNGSSISAGGGGEQQTTANSLTVPLSSLHWGSNTLWVQAYDASNNLSQAVAYTFYVQQSAFGPYTPGTAGDIDGDNKPDLVTVDASGAVRLFSNAELTHGDPTGDLNADPQQYGGRVLIPATSNARWPVPDRASAAGALIAHGGSFTGFNYDDLVVVQNGFLAVARNPGTPTGTWTFATTNIQKPACGGCADYNGQDWSSVTQMTVVPGAPGAAPALLTVESVNDVATLWLYEPVTGSYQFQAPTAISVSNSTWNWNDEQIIGVSPNPQSNYHKLWVRELSDGLLLQLLDLELGIPDPYSASYLVAEGFNMDTHPLLTMGRSDNVRDLPLWATNSSGALQMIPTSTDEWGTITVMPTVTVSSTGWGNHELALDGNYAQFNNTGVGIEGQRSGDFNVTTAETDAYSNLAMANATLDPNTIVNDGSGGCPIAWTSPCAAGLGPQNIISVLRGSTYDSFALPAQWDGSYDNYVAAGQVLPVPTPNTSGPARTISFLGSADTTTASQAVNVTITYTNGHTQATTIQFSDWLSGTPATGDIVVATMDHHVADFDGGTSPGTNYLYATPDITLLDNGQPLANNVQIASVTLSSNASVHVFSIALSG